MSFMPITNCLRAWDDTNKTLRSLGLTTYGNQQEPSEGEKRLRESLTNLGKARLPKQAILELARFAESIIRICNE